MAEGVFVGKRQEIAFWVIEDFRSGKISRSEAAKILGVSLKTVSRRAARVRSSGLAGLRHGNKGRAASNRLPQELREQVLQLVKERYFDFNLVHTLEMLRDQHNLRLSYATLHAWVREAALGRGRRKRRPSRARVQRERMANEGLLLQMDGSHHRWNGRDEWCLIAMIDDATSDVPCAEFFPGETTVACLKLLGDLVMKKGIPDIIYTDEAGWADRSGGKRQQFSQFKRACDELGIRLITTRSPQSKGRIENAWKTFQDRLVPELRLNEIKGMLDANRYLKQTFIPQYWSRLQVAPRNSETRYKPLPAHLDISQITCLKYTRQVASDHCVHFENERYRIVDLRFGSLRGKEIAVHRYPDERIELFHGHLRLRTERVTEPKRRWERRRPA